MWAGILIGLGFVLVLSKLSIRRKLWLTTNEVTSDVVIFIVVTIIHGMIGGGVDGVVHAAIAAGVCSIYTGWLRKRIGYWGPNGLIQGTQSITRELEETQ